MRIDNQVCWGFAVGSLVTCAVVVLRRVCSTWKNWRMNRRMGVAGVMRRDEKAFGRITNPCGLHRISELRRAKLGAGSFSQTSSRNTAPGGGTGVTR